MWETLFDPSMLDSGKEIAIWCPREVDAGALMVELRKAGCKWNGGDPLDPYRTRWGCYMDEMVYYVNRTRVAMGDRAYAVKCGDKYTMCVFDPGHNVLCEVAPEVGDLI